MQGVNKAMSIAKPAMQYYENALQGWQNAMQGVNNAMSIAKPAMQQYENAMQREDSLRSRFSIPL